MGAQWRLSNSKGCPLTTYGTAPRSAMYLRACFYSVRFSSGRDGAA